MLRKKHCRITCFKKEAFRIKHAAFYPIFYISDATKRIQEMSYEDKDREFYKSLNTYYSSFYAVKELHSRDRAKKVLDNLEREIKDGYESDEETTRSQNLRASLLWSIGGERAKEAENLINSALSTDPNNIISLANKAHILRGSLQFSDSESVLDELRKLSTLDIFEQLLIKSEADVAYSFARFGPSYLKRAVKHYERAVAKLQGKYLWNFGLALAYKRSAHVLNSENITDAIDCRTNDKAADLFLDIIHNSTTKQLQGESWIELGELMRFRSQKGIRKSFPNLSPKRCCEEALKLCQNDHYVLQKCGRLFRYVGKLPLSEKYLRDSYQEKDTPFARHHLALILKKMYELNARKPKNKNKKYDSKSKRSGSLAKTALCTTTETADAMCNDNSRLHEAIEHLEKAIELSNGLFPRAKYEIGLLYQMLGQREKAIESFQDTQLSSNVSTTEVIHALEQL